MNKESYCLLANKLINDIAEKMNLAKHFINSGLLFDDEKKEIIKKLKEAIHHEF